MGWLISSSEKNDKISSPPLPSSSFPSDSPGILISINQSPPSYGVSLPPCWEREDVYVCVRLSRGRGSGKVCVKGEGMREGGGYLFVCSGWQGWFCLDGCLAAICVRWFEIKSSASSLASRDVGGMFCSWSWLFGGHFHLRPFPPCGHFHLAAISTLLAFNSLFNSLCVSSFFFHCLCLNSLRISLKW